MSIDPLPDWTAIVAERKIKEAMDAGEFDNLAGKGQPLDLDENPFDPPGQHIVNRILKQSGTLPAWAQVAQEIQREIEALAPSRERGLRAVQFAKNEPSRLRAIDKLKADYHDRLKTINSLILKYNYTVPTAAQRPFRTFRIPEELASLEAAILDATFQEAGRNG